MAYTSAQATNTVLSCAEEKGIKLDPMKLQKLLYLTHGYYLGANGSPWVKEHFEAWDYGPVLPSIYHEFKEYGSSRIKEGERASEVVKIDGKFRMQVPNAIEEDDTATSEVLSYVIEAYGSKSGVYLSNLTHKVGSPWDNVRKESGGARGADIPDELIEEYFAKLVRKK